MNNNTAKKTQSLAYPANPLVAIRELQLLDEQRKPAPPREPLDQGSTENATALPVANATSSVVVNNQGCATADTPQPDLPTKQGKSAAPGKRKEPAPQEEASDEANPLERAVLQMLGQPYTADAVKGPFTITTVKIPTEVWERLGWAASLTGQAKQEIIAEALKQWFASLVKGRVEAP